MCFDFDFDVGHCQRLLSRSPFFDLCRNNTETDVRCFDAIQTPPTPFPFNIQFSPTLLFECLCAETAEAAAAVPHSSRQLLKMTV